VAEIQKELIFCCRIENGFSTDYLKKKKTRLVLARNSTPTLKCLDSCAPKSGWGHSGWFV